MRSVVVTRVIHPPSANFSTTATTRMERQRMRPMMWMMMWRYQSGYLLRSRNQ